MNAPVGEEEVALLLQSTLDIANLLDATVIAGQHHLPQPLIEENAQAGLEEHPGPLFRNPELKGLAHVQGVMPMSWGIGYCA